jgi:nucleoside-diphosphate-sugar epimerase
MSSKLNIFFTGATGYIGGSVLIRLLEHPDAASFNITALVRSAAKAEKLQKEFGVNAVVGSHTDAALVEELTSKADFVIATADADDMTAAKATLRGMKKYFERTGKQPVLIHTSGTGVLTDKAAGDNTNDVIYDDLNADQIETLPDSQLHRDVDLTLLQADKEGYVRVHIVVPSTIYGIAKGRLVDAGIQNAHSIQVPELIRAALAIRQAGMVGQGKNYWPDVHVEDVADLYIVVFDAIRKNPDSVGHGRHGFFFGETGEHQMFEIAEAMGKALVELGLGTNPAPRPFTKEELDKYLGGSTYLGTNSRCRSNHGRKLGWKPSHTKADFLASIKFEVEALAKKANLL